MMGVKHTIKLSDKYYQRVISGQKTFEIRKNDRDYQVGDTLLMFDPDVNLDMYSDMPSNYIHAKIVYMTTEFQQEGYCVLGIEIINRTKE